MRPKKLPNSKRPYRLGRRQAMSDERRAAILKAARARLEASGFSRFTLEALASDSGVTRQTVHNLFGTRSGILEALFDQLAFDAGMGGMREVIECSDPGMMLEGFVDIFCHFWARDRLLIRRIHGIAAIDPEFGKAVAARNQRRLRASSRVTQRVAGHSTAEHKAEIGSALYALTSFEFFDQLADSCGHAGEATRLIHRMVRQLIRPQGPNRSR